VRHEAGKGPTKFIGRLCEANNPGPGVSATRELSIFDYTAGAGDGSGLDDRAIRTLTRFPYGPFMRTDDLTGTHQCRRGSEGRLRAELDRAIAGKPVQGSVRPEILASWRRAASAGLRPDRFDLGHLSDIDCESPLLGAALFLVDRLAADLALTEISVVLSDGQGRILATRVPDPFEALRLDEVMLAPGYDWSFVSAGTNGLSDSLFTRSPSVVVGAEHFCDALTSMVTAGAPIRDPRTGQVVGAVGLVCSASAANSLLLPMARRAAREIGQEVVGGQANRDRLLEEAFWVGRRRSRGPVAVVSRDRLFTNTAAARLIDPTDQPRLWEFASSCLGSNQETGPVFITGGGSALPVVLEAVVDGTALAGVMVRFSGALGRSAELSAPTRLAPRTVGWDNLTEAELSVTELVAEGLTNRRIASKLFISPYTVDSHLRHIFQKLDISSRVDLVRIATSRAAAVSTLVA
jgi:DNA-binding CsgD family transcriptional regulator